MNHLNKISSADLIELKKQYQGDDLDIVLNKIENGYPVQYVIGNVNFYGNVIEVNENVLIPRYETEFLVDLINKLLPKDRDYTILDLGTGSGCIAISLAKLFKNSEVYGIDISNEAINVANKNKEINKVTNVTFNCTDMNLIDDYSNYDVIVSNPPYVSFDENTGIETKYEPQNAIFADNSGLYFYELILKTASNSKTKPKHIFFEIGMTQAEKISKYVKTYLPDYNINTYKDLSGKDRYIHIYE